jgi:hypothetical protein
VNDLHNPGGDLSPGAGKSPDTSPHETSLFERRGPPADAAGEPLVLHLVLYDTQNAFGPDSNTIVVERGAVLHAIPAVIEMVGATALAVDGRRFATLIYLRDVPGLAAYSADPVHHRYAFDWFLPATRNVQVGDFVIDSPPPASFGAVEMFMTAAHQAIAAEPRRRFAEALASVRRVPGVVAVQAGQAVEPAGDGAIGGVIFFSSVAAAEAARGHADYVRWLGAARELPFSGRFFGSAARIPPPAE